MPGWANKHDNTGSASPKGATPKQIVSEEQRKLREEAAKAAAEVEPLAVLSHHSAAVSCVRFSADSARLASAGDTSVALWDIYATKEDAGGAGGG